jgi:hypothetical protein
MISCSHSDDSPAGRTRRVGRLVTVASALVLAGCRQQPFDETKVDFIRNAQTECNPQGVTMDTYIVEMYEVKDEALRNQAISSPQKPTSLDCDQCIADPARCSLEVRLCRCSSEMPATPENLKSGVAGARLSSLERNDFYCLRVLGVRRDTVGGAAPTPCSENCDQIWKSLSLGDEAQVCAISQPLDVGGQNFEMNVKCPSDTEFTGGGFGGGGRNMPTFSFAQCILPNPCDRPDAGVGGDACPGN